MPISDIGFNHSVKLISQINWGNLFAFTIADYSFTKVVIHTFAVPTIDTTSVVLRGFY